MQSGQLPVNFHHPPDQLTNDQLQDYLYYLLKERKLAWSTCNVHFSAIKCFYDDFLKRQTDVSIPPRPRQKQISLALSKDEVKKLIYSCTNLKHRTLLLTVYSAGLRVSEAVKLEPVHIERSRKMIRVEQGKGRKDRYTLLSDQLLETLEEYWRTYRPGKWIFFGKTRSKPMPVETAQQIYYKTKKRAGIIRGRGISYITALLCHTSSGTWNQHPCSQTSAGTSVHTDHSQISSHQQQNHIKGNQPFGYGDPVIAGSCMKSSRPKHDIADIFRHFGRQFLETFNASHEQIKVMNRIVSCRTAALGGHVDFCPDCDYSEERLQLLQESSLPQMPDHDQGEMAGQTGVGTIACHLLSSGVYIAP